MPATIARVARNVLLTLALGILAVVLAAGALWISLPSVDGLAYRIPRTTAVIGLSISRCTATSPGSEWPAYMNTAGWL